MFFFFYFVFTCFNEIVHTIHWFISYVEIEFSCNRFEFFRDYIEIRNGKILFNNPGEIRVGNIFFFLPNVFKIAFGQRLDFVINSCKNSDGYKRVQN